MTNQRTTKPKKTTVIAVALIASCVAASGALAGAFTPNDSRAGGFLDWKDTIGPDVAPGLPGGFEVDDNGEDDPGAPRAHSDVPDLPDSGGDPGENSATAGGPETSTAGNGLFEPAEVPGLKDIIFEGDSFVVALKDFSQPLPSNDASYASQTGMPQIAPAFATIPSPAGGVLFALAGAGLARRRRR